MELKGKKLLLLGGHVLMTHVVQKAREMGVETVVTDYVPGAPAKAIADKSYDVSTHDVDAVVELARAESVDGVFTGYVDINLVPCCRVCDVLGLPFYATESQLNATLNKVRFKELCRKYDLRVAEDIDVDLIDNNPNKINFPVIIKPADSYSSKGVSVCHKPETLQPAITRALEFSACRQVVVEEYINGDDVYFYFTLQDGHLSLSAMADRLLNDEQFGLAPQPVGYFFPSRYIDLYFEQVHEKVTAMMVGLGMKNGTFFLQGFVRDGEIILFEMGPRLSGGAGYLPIGHHSKIDLLAMHVRYALTGSFSGFNIQQMDNPKFKKPYFVLVVLLRNGTIKTVNGLEWLQSHRNVFHILQFRNENDTMAEEGTLNQVFARIYLYGEDKAELHQVISDITRQLTILDEQGENMILNWFNPELLLG